MDALSAVTDALFDWLVTTSWQVAVLVALVLAAEAAFARRLAPRWRYRLWLLVVLRLCVPALPEVEGGAFGSALDPLVLETRRAGGVDVDAPRADAGRLVVTHAAPAPRVEPEPADGEPEPAVTSPATPEAEGPVVAARPRRPAAAPVPRSSAPAPPPASAVEPAPPAARPLDRRGIAVLAWLAVALALLARHAAREVRFRRRLAREPRVALPHVRALLDECRARAGVRRPVELVHTELVGSPAVTGVLRPRILLPAAVLVDFDASELRHVLLHELAHVRRGDVALAALAALLQSAFWFHPLVHLALARLRAAQEPARDADALAWLPSPAPRPYAHTLLRLCERAADRRPAPVVGLLRSAHETRRRVTMIADFDRTSRRGRLLGAALVAALGWAGFTAAASTPLPAALGDAAQEARPELRRIRVVRQRPLAAWEERVHAQLAEPIVLDVQDLELPALLEELGARTGLNVVLAPDARDEATGHSLSIQGPTTGADVLRTLCRTIEDLVWGLAGEAVLVGLRYEVPQSHELRFYDIRPIEETAGEVFAADRIVELVQHLVPDGAWDDGFARIEAYDEMLAVHQRPEIHERVHTVLERILNRGRRTGDGVPAWRRVLDTRLDRRVDVAWHDASLVQVVADLRRMGEIPVELADAEDAADVRVDLALHDVRLGTVLDWVAGLTGRRVSARDGLVVLGEEPEFVTEFHEVGALLGAGFERDHIEDLVRDQVDPDSWDSFWQCAILWFDGMMITVNSPEAQRETAALLDALRRVRGG